MSLDTSKASSKHTSESSNTDFIYSTDAFDVGSSTSVTISGANVKNQDDCLVGSALFSKENIC